MVTISNGAKTIRVTRSAYQSIFASMGFYEVSSINPRENQENVTRDESDASEVIVEIDEAEDNSEEHPQEVSEEDSEIEEILTKPISSWTADELRRVVKEKNIDTKSASNVKQAKAIVKKVLGI